MRSLIDVALPYKSYLTWVSEEKRSCRVLSACLSYAVLALIFIFSPGSSFGSPTSGAPKNNDAEKNLNLAPNFESLPTFITSDSLLLQSDRHVFTYTGNVVVKHGDMTLTSDVLEGTYDDKNQIKQLIAKSNVVITKAENIRATSQHAVYDKSTETVTLTDSPALEQKGSTLEADKVRVFLKENRSTAEGAVRVKLLNVKGDLEPGKK